MNPQDAKSLQEVVVFIDYQNLYNDARRAFAKSGDAAPFGQVHPIKLAQLLVARQPMGVTAERTLKEVRAYRGRPDSTKEPKTYGAHMRQSAAWEKAGVNLIHRPLRYPHDWPASPPEEKGIDVQLAIDVAVMAVNGEFDVAIIASTDTDLQPALEAFFALPFDKERLVEVAAYKSPTFKKALRIPGQHVWCHFIEEADFLTVCDKRDYNIKSR